MNDAKALAWALSWANWATNWELQFARHFGCPYNNGTPGRGAKHLSRMVEVRFVFLLVVLSVPFAITGIIAVAGRSEMFAQK